MLQEREHNTQEKREQEDETQKIQLISFQGTDGTYLNKANKRSKNKKAHLKPISQVDETSKKREIESMDGSLKIKISVNLLCTNNHRTT